MKRNLRQKPRNKQKLRTRFIIISGATIIVLTLTMGWLVFLNISMNTNIKASLNSTGGSLLNNGEIISEFTWENSPATKATLGPDAIKISSNAHTAVGGRASTYGLASGNPAKDIDMEIASSPLFDVEGIDIMIDFKRNEPSGSFFSRGKSLEFGFKKGYINISYRVFSVKGGYESITETTGYEIPQDGLFRNYRFIYTPASGKAEIFVNSVIVWSHQGERNTSMYWKEAGNIIIGQGIDGGGIDQPVLDNLVIRTAGSISPLAESLINFMLEVQDNKVKVQWTSSENSKVEYYTIERSVNGVDFSNLVDVKSNSELKDEATYSYEDKTVPAPGIMFYRIRETFRDGKFITEAVSAIKMKFDKDLTIDKVSPDPFQTTFNLSYYIPSPGTVQVQLIDEKGKIKSSEIFEALQGKNIYIFHGRNDLASGVYTLNLVHKDKRIFARVTKI